jgi:hypothetical protein
LGSALLDGVYHVDKRQLTLKGETRVDILADKFEPKCRNLLVISNMTLVKELT